MLPARSRRPRRRADVSSAAPAASHTGCELSYRSAVGSGADQAHDVDDPVNAADGRRGGFERPPAALERAGGAPSGTREMFFIVEAGRAQFRRARRNFFASAEERDEAS